MHLTFIVTFTVLILVNFPNVNCLLKLDDDEKERLKDDFVKGDVVFCIWYLCYSLSICMNLHHVVDGCVCCSGTVSRHPFRIERMLCQLHCLLTVSISAYTTFPSSYNITSEWMKPMQMWPGLSTYMSVIWVNKCFLFTHSDNHRRHSITTPTCGLTSECGRSQPSEFCRMT